MIRHEARYWYQTRRPQGTSHPSVWMICVSEMMWFARPREAPAPRQLILLEILAKFSYIVDDIFTSHLHMCSFFQHTSRNLRIDNFMHSKMDAMKQSFLAHLDLLVCTRLMTLNISLNQWGLDDGWLLAMLGASKTGNIPGFHGVISLSKGWNWKRAKYTGKSFSIQRLMCSWVSVSRWWFHFF